MDRRHGLDKSEAGGAVVAENKALALLGFAESGKAHHTVKSRSKQGFKVLTVERTQPGLTQPTGHHGAVGVRDISENND